MNNTQLAEEIERQRARCEAVQVIFEPLDRDRLSLMLKAHPDLVDDFFGRSWVEAFNGVEAAAALAGRKLSREQKLSARRFILTLYATHFQMVDGGIPAAASAFRGAVKPVPVFDRYVEPDIELVESIIEQEQAQRVETEKDNNSARKESSSTGFRRREIRTKLALSAALAASDRFLLLGGAGFGKSAALRVIIHSLLSDDARFPAVAKSWGQRLPLLLPFGFLTRHFAEQETPTIESALNAWLKVLGAKSDVLVLLEEMVRDERLLLLVDGLDEWQNREAAVAALTALTAYVQTRRLPLVATSRPLGFERISDFGPDWKRANLLPLSTNQQRKFATYWFRHFHEANAALDSVALGQAVTRDADEFTNDLSSDRALAELAGIPLLLSVIVYLRLTGRVLPHSRLAALEELTKALLEDQPRRRAQAAMQRADQSVARSPRIRRGIEYLAYCIHQEPSSVVISNDRATLLLRDYFSSELELSASDAEDWANRILELGQHEFGLLIAPQEEHVGLMHRILQEFLAAKHLAQLSLEQVRNYCRETGRQGTWHEVTLTLMHLLERQDDVDGLIKELRQPVADCLDEPLQQILLARLAVAEINSSPSTARELLSQVFSWIEYGRWMPLRVSLVQEVAAGVESEHVGALVAARVDRWFPGRVSWLGEIPHAAVKNPTSETLSDLRIALHNCDGAHEYRRIAEALSSLAQSAPQLADELIAMLREAGEPEFLGAALHALALGWPTHSALPALLNAASAAPAKELRYVAILARFRRGERSPEIRHALVGFCEGELPWPWEDQIVAALATGWPCDPDLKLGALKRMRSIGFPKSWVPKVACDYLLKACPGDDDVARMLAEQLGLEGRSSNHLLIRDCYKDLLAGFTRHPLLVPAAETWLEKNARSQLPLEVAVIAKLGGTPKCRLALLQWLQRGDSMPAWIISTLLEMSEPDDSEVRAALLEYIRDAKRRSEAARWLPEIVRDPKELGVMLRDIVRDAHVFESSAALAVLVEKEGRDTPDLWPLVQTRIVNDEGGHYWRLAHHVLLQIWPQHSLIRQLVKETVYDEHISRSALYEAYGTDPEIRPLLDRTLQALHEDLRVEIARAIEPLARRGSPAAIKIAAKFIDEPNGEARTIAARAYARARVRAGSELQDLTASFTKDVSGILSYHEERRQAGVAALLELGRADLLAVQREFGRAVEFDTYSKSRHNWEFVASVVEHWEALAMAMPDVWQRFRNSAIIGIELAKAGKANYAVSQTRGFEHAVRSGQQLDIESVKALIAIHSRSSLLRDLFLARLGHFLPGQHQSMMVSEKGAYHEMASYLAQHFHGDQDVGKVMESVANSLLRDVALVALCRGWPEMLPIAASAKLPELIDADEPVTAWLFASKADAALMAQYVVRYPHKLMRDYFGEPRYGIEAVRGRLQIDRECRKLVFAELHAITEPDTLIALAELLAPSMRTEPQFRTWMSNRLRATREASRVLCQLAFDVFANAYKPVEFALFEAALTRY